VGLTSRQARTMVRTQAAVFAVAALLIGVPLGLALGRTLGRVAAGIMPLRYEPPTPHLALALVGPLALLAVLVLAAAPARRVARLRVAQALRRE
jgi:ABC-type antimicrobial peptide transport system permease subunit